MLSLTAVPQELITTMSRAQRLYLQEQTDARYIHITHHLKKKVREREVRVTDGQQPPAPYHLRTEPLDSSPATSPPSPLPAQVAAELSTAENHVPMTSTRACAMAPSYLETPGSSLLGPWAWEAA